MGLVNLGAEHLIVANIALLKPKEYCKFVLTDKSLNLTDCMAAIQANRQ